MLSQVEERAPRTLLLILGAATIWLVLGVSIGVLSAVKRHTVADRAAMGFVLFGISAPVFWLGLMAPVHLLEEAALDRRHRVRPDHREPARLLLAHDPALDRARAAVRGDLRPHDA